MDFREGGGGGGDVGKNKSPMAKVNEEFGIANDTPNWSTAVRFCFP